MRRAVNNAIVPFQTFGQVGVYLRSRWAGMMHSFLTRDAEADQRGQSERDGEEHGPRHGLGVSVATFMLLLDISGCP
jgi:hypothetical protein